MRKVPQYDSQLTLSPTSREQLTTAVEPRRKLLETSQREKFPYTIEACGITLEVDGGVFSPKYFESSGFFCEMLPPVKGLRLLDMGCGCGIVAIASALADASIADAVDITASAVANTRRNAARIGVSHIVHAWQSDLFSEVPENSEYDVIFWNPPWVFIEPTYLYRSQLEMSVFDPGYLLLSRFLSEAPHRLSSEGRILLGFGDFGNSAELDRLVDQFSYSKNEIARRSGKAPDHFTYILYEIRPSR
jgi:Methylase of polypeptide chain release factors